MMSSEQSEHAAWAEFAEGDRLCYACGHPCLPEDHPVTSKCGNYFKHFTCWYGDVIPARLEEGRK